MKQFFSSLFAAAAFTFALFFPKIILDGAKYGLNLWFHTLLPTLLPFMILSNLFIQSRMIQPLMAFPGKYAEKYLGISPAGLYAFICGFFFGYPSGAKILADLLKTGQIEKKEASWLLGFCNNASPAFLMTYFVAEQLHHPEKTPETLLLLYGIPALICLLPLFFKQIRHPVQPFSPADTDCTKKASNHALSFALFDACISDAIAVMLKLGGYITLFAVLSNAIANIPHLSSGCAALLCAAFEITNGIPAVMAAFPYPQSYVILLPFLTFGGVCSLMQTGSVIKDTPLSWRSYFLCKLLLAVPVLFAGLLIA